MNNISAVSEILLDYFEVANAFISTECYIIAEKRTKIRERKNSEKKDERKKNIKARRK